MNRTQRRGAVLAPARKCFAIAAVIAIAGPVFSDNVALANHG
jgi:glucokinase